MTYCKNYCEEKGISTSELNEAQKTLYHVAENMKIFRTISEEGYKHFQMAIKALEQIDVLDKIRAELETDTDKWWYGVNDDCFIKLSDVIAIIDKYREETEECRTKATTNP